MMAMQDAPVGNDKILKLADVLAKRKAKRGRGGSIGEQIRWWPLRLMLCLPAPSPPTFVCCITKQALESSSACNIPFYSLFSLLLYPSGFMLTLGLFLLLFFFFLSPAWAFIFLSFYSPYSLLCISCLYHVAHALCADISLSFFSFPFLYPVESLLQWIHEMIAVANEV